jgi:hypothetical protein
MGNGSSAQDGDGWTSAQNPYGDDALSGPGPYGPAGPSEPRDVPAGRREVPFGPDMSWPNGFRRIDPEARRLLESGFGRGQYDRSGTGNGGAGQRPGYPQPATDDYGYGDPGYSDPSYEGPRAAGGVPLAGSAGYGGFPGYQAPDFRAPSRPDAGYQPGWAPDIYPSTGAQEALTSPGPPPAEDAGPARERPVYPEQWYDHPRLDEPRPASDPRLEGMRYDELRYEEPLGGESGYNEPLDDESWFGELRRSAPSYPQQPASGPAVGQRGGDASGPGYGQRPGMGQPGGFPEAPGYGPGRGPDPQGPVGPRMSAAVEAGPGPRTPAAPQNFAGYLGAPTAQVGVLTPPAVERVEEPARYAAAESGLADRGPQQAVAGASLAPARPVRPGHGLDGPEITSSWPVQPQVEDPESFADFWAEDDDDPDYAGLFPAEDGGTGQQRRIRGRAKATTGRIGRRRSGSNDHRLWLAMGGVLVVAAAAIVGIIKLEFPSHSGPAHTMVTPAKIGSYVRTPDMERQAKVSQLRAEVIKMSSGQASNVVSAVYESGNSAAGNTEQIVMFIGGHLANAAPASSIASFRQDFANAVVTGAGPLGGQAACVEEAGGTSDAVSLCSWFDNDSFGEVVSPTMNANSLAGVMHTMRPSVELVAKK